MRTLQQYWKPWAVQAVLGFLMVQMAGWAWAVVINVDFQPGGAGGGQAAPYTGQGAYPDPGNNTWNIVAPATNGAFNWSGSSGGYYNSNVVTSLVDSTGAATGVVLTVYADPNPPPNNTGAYATSNSDIAQNAFNLCRDYIIAFNSTTQRVEITGLDDTAWYDLYLYGVGAHTVRRTLFQITGANLHSQNLRTRGIPGGLHNLQKGNDYVIAHAVRPTGGKITIEYSTAGNTNNAEGVFAGLQLVQRADIYQVLINDQFDEGGPASNPSGIGSGFEYKQIQSGVRIAQEGLHGSAPAEGFLMWCIDANWAFGGLSSKDSWKPLPAVTAHTRWTHQRVYVDADQGVTYPQFPGGEQSDFRIQYGLVSANRPVTGNNDLYNNTSGGLYVNLFYEREASATNLTLTGNIRAVTKAKTSAGDTEGLAGLVTLATFRLGEVAGITGGDFGQILDVMIDADLNGWRVSFADQNGPITPTVLSGSLSGGWTNLSSVLDGETISFTDEFVNGAFLFAGAQGIGAGRGSVVFDSVFVYLSVPEPTTWTLFALGSLLLAGMGYRRLRR